MIVDLHAHIFHQEEDMEQTFITQSQKAAGHEYSLSTDWEQYFATAPQDTVAVVFGGKAKLSGLWVDDRRVADFVTEHSDRTIGFLSVDLAQPGWQEELEFGHQELKLRGIKLLPMYAGFDITDPQFDYFWEYVTKHHLPVLMHTGTTFMSQAVLKYTKPVLVDDVARKFPEAKIIMAHLSHPYEGECLAVIRKHPNVYADISALHYRPFQFWNALMLAQEYGVMHKLLFGSDFPFTTVDDTIAELRRLTTIEFPGFAPLDAESIEAMIYRDSRAIFNI